MGRHVALGICGLWLLSACSAQTSPAVTRDTHPREPLAIAARAPEAQPARHPDPPLAVAAQTPPKLEVVFVLDTTGSMSSLIEGAKQKIWSIADELANGQPKPELSIGLVAYRDRGDAYVTKRVPLSTDLDAIYQELHAFAADGGGDGPESVNQALYEAVHGTAWSNERNVYRAVFLVGDAPPHMDYQDDVPYEVTARAAAERGIVINTVQCGEMDGTKDVWLAISQVAQGTYAAIAQSGGMLQIAAPMDGDIGRLNARLSSTVVPYGRVEKQREVRRKADMAVAAPAAVSASRQSFLRKGGGAVVTGGGDLVDDVSRGQVKLEEVSAEELPPELRAMSLEERRAEVARRAKERKKLQDELDGLVKQRAEYVKNEEQKRRARGERDGFDGEVMKAVKAQAAEAGIAY